MFAPDTKMILPQAYTATQLFGIKRVTGIKLETATGILGPCQLFRWWLAFIPAGDHKNVINPPGVTVMRISGGRYRVTGAHRVVWRWMSKFSLPSNKGGASTSARASPPHPSLLLSDGDVRSSTGNNIGSGRYHNNVHASIADFNPGNLVTMTIVKVFKMDSDGKLLSYCPTFDNQAVHRTQEVAKRIHKGASLVRERMGVAARSPAGKSANKVS
jgi:hypothetical protein